MGDFITNFVNIINSIIAYIKELVKTIRIINDGDRNKDNTDEEA